MLRSLLLSQPPSRSRLASGSSAPWQNWALGQHSQQGACVDIPRRRPHKRLSTTHLALWSQHCERQHVVLLSTRCTAHVRHPYCVTGISLRHQPGERSIANLSVPGVCLCPLHRPSCSIETYALYRLSIRQDEAARVQRPLRRAANVGSDTGRPPVINYGSGVPRTCRTTLTGIASTGWRCCCPRRSTCRQSCTRSAQSYGTDQRMLQQWWVNTKHPLTDHLERCLHRHGGLQWPLSRGSALVQDLHNIRTSFYKDCISCRSRWV